jgi:hypothetical protein
MHVLPPIKASPCTIWPHIYACTMAVRSQMIGWCAKAKGDPPFGNDAHVHGETGNRTQNLLHSTGAVKHDAKKMSYH